MYRYCTTVALVTLLAAPVSFANPSEPDYAPFARTRLSVENKLPAAGQRHLGTDFTLTEFNDNEEDFVNTDLDRYTVAPYLRYGLRDDVILDLKVPFHYADTEDSSEIGIGDVEIGLKLKAFEDVFEYPFIIPHITGIIQTGDEDEGLGNGYNAVRFGISFGTVIGDAYAGSHGDNWTWIFDVAYEVRTDFENVAQVALSTVWDIDDRFAIVSEVGVSEEDEAFSDEGAPVTVSLGLSYDFDENMQMTLYGASVVNTEEDAIITLNYVRNF